MIADPKRTRRVKPAPVSKEIEKTQTLFNRWIRWRDRELKCISCERGEPENAGHYFSVGQHSALRFHPVNVNGQCISCNKWKHGNLAYYRIGLVRKWGEAAVLELEALARREPLKKWTRAELEAIREQVKTSFKT